jgi:hypothetical protein
MSDHRMMAAPGRPRRWAVALLLAAAVAPAARGQGVPAPAGPAPVPLPLPADAPRPEPTLITASCKSCEGGIAGLAGGCASCSGCGVGCVPGRKPCCCPCEGKTVFGRIVNGLAECICCPDPCYEGHWIPIADSAFFADAPRPITQMRLRYEGAWDFTFPDRAEYFWAAQRLRGQPPPPPVPPVPGARVSNPKGPAPPQREIDYSQISLYTEVAVGRFGAFFEIPYREVNSLDDQVDFSGFADIIAGTKSLLVDCPLAQLALQFKVFAPSGQASKGLGTGHVSLEPSLLLGLRLAPDTYLQTQFAYWIPIGGDQIYAGDIFHYHLSFNQVLWRPAPRLTFIGTMEFNGWSVLDGAFTDPAILDINGQIIPQSARTHIFSMGPGIRCFICDVIDLGVGSAFAVTDPNFGGQVVRAEFRWRF